MGLLLWQLWAQRVINRAEPLAGRFIRLGNGSVWEHGEADSFYPGWTALSLTESTLAFDTATGQICRTNAYSHLFE
jgi:hypothetical protein